MRASLLPAVLLLVGCGAPLSSEPEDALSESSMAISRISIRKVGQLPSSRAPNLIGRQVEELLPPAGALPLRSSLQPGSRAVKHLWFSTPGGETRVTYPVEAGGTVSLRPTSVHRKEGGSSTSYWATQDTGAVYWQQTLEGSGAGAWFENILDENGDRHADVLVQGYLGGAATRFEQDPLLQPRAPRGPGLSNLTPAQLSFLISQELVGALTATQRNIVSERANYEAALRGRDLTQLSGRFGWISMSEAKKSEALAAGATIWRQLLDYAYYGSFLPLEIEQRWLAMFPRS
ncbi:MAG: hypothetical protein ACT4TC_20625 [Myxococcaceae bacterium]